MGHADDDEGKHLFGTYIYPFHWSLVKCNHINLSCVLNFQIFQLALNVSSFYFTSLIYMQKNIICKRHTVENQPACLL